MAKVNEASKAVGAPAKKPGKFMVFLAKINPVKLCKRFWRFIREVYVELKKVTWPGRKELVNYTVAVLIFVAIFGVITFVMDTGLSALVNLLWQ